MNAFALHHFPERDGLGRWITAALAIMLLHAGLIAAVVLWYARSAPEPAVIPAIAVSFVPVTSAPEMQQQDVAVGQPMQQAEEAPPEPPKTEQPKIEQPPVERTPEPPPRQAEVTLPRPEPKPVEKKKPVERRPPAPETRAAPKSERVAPASTAGAMAYNSLVFGHLQRFKRYPSDANGAAGVTVVRFTVNRAGQVLASSVTKSSGNAALDREALDILRRANPFPPFPDDKAGAQDTFAAPISFAQR